MARTTPRPRPVGRPTWPPFFYLMCPPTPRTIVYVDGFNLYYGVLKDTPYKWLDLERLFRFLRPHDDIQAIKYFTAIVAPGPSRERQDALLRAFAMLPLVEIIPGRFKRKRVTCACPGCVDRTRGTGVFTVPEEKRTDVNIAIHMLDDAYRQRCERQVLVSGDSDLVPPIQMVRERFPRIRTTVYVPARTRVRGAARELRGVAHRHRTFPLELLPLAQLPLHLPDGRGGTIQKPAAW